MYYGCIKRVLDVLLRDACGIPATQITQAERRVTHASVRAAEGGHTTAGSCPLQEAHLPVKQMAFGPRGASAAARLGHSKLYILEVRIHNVT